MPPAYTIECPSCHWKKTVIPASAIPTPFRDWFYQCPRCTHSQLQRRAPKAKELLLARLEQALAGHCDPRP